MKKLAILFLTVLTITSLSACGGAGSTRTSEKNKQLGKGKEMSLTFDTNPTTGYDWQYELKDGEAELILDRQDEKKGNSSDVAGAGFKRTYFFRASKAGKVTLSFIYKRPWEGGEEAYDVLYDLTVDENLVITCENKKKGRINSDKELNFFPNPVFSE